MHRSTALSFALSFALSYASSMPARAEPPLVVVSAAYESPTLLAPAVQLIARDADGGSMAGGFVGWTLGIEREWALGPRSFLGVGAEVTPLNANASDIHWRDGHDAAERDFTDRSWLSRLGGRVEHPAGLSSRLELLARREWIADAPQSLRDRWRGSYAGLRIAEQWSAVRADDRYRQRWDGLKAAGEYTLWGGGTPFWQTRLQVGVGRTFGAAHLQLAATLLDGDGLDEVTRFRVGGSWDVPGVDLLYGFHYAEFRVERAALFRGGLDLALSEHVGFGLRSACMLSRAETRLGTALRVEADWHGIVVYAGLGLPNDQALNWSRAVAFAGLTAAVFEPWSL